MTDLVFIVCRDTYTNIFKEREKTMTSNLSHYVELAMKGDRAAFEEIYKQTYWTVYYTCFSFLKNEQDAADTTQEIYITVMNSLSTLKDTEKFPYWLNRIAVNKCKNILVRNIPATVDMDSMENVIPEENENFLPEDYITNKEKRRLVMNIIRTSLNDAQYQTVFLHYFNGFSVSEISEIMECPVGTVTYRLSVARGKIKQAVNRYENTNNEKLYSFAGLPLLACIFTEEFKSLYNTSPTPANIFNSVSANTIIKEAAKKGADGMLKTAKAKIIAGVAGVVVAGGIVTGIAIGITNKNKEATGTPTTKTIVADNQEDTTPENIGISEETSSSEDTTTEQSVDNVDTDTGKVFMNCYLNDVNWGEEKDLTGLTLFSPDCTIPIDLEKIDQFSPYYIDDYRASNAGFTATGELPTSFAEFIMGATGKTLSKYDSFDIYSCNEDYEDFYGPNIHIQGYEEGTLKDWFEDGYWYINEYTQNEHVDRKIVDIPMDTTDENLAQTILDKFGKPSYVRTDGIGFTDISSSKRLTLDESATVAGYEFIYEREDYVLQIEIQEGNYSTGHYAISNQVHYFTKTMWDKYEAETYTLPDGSSYFSEIPME